MTLNMLAHGYLLYIVWLCKEKIESPYPNLLLFLIFLCFNITVGGDLESAQMSCSPHAQIMSSAGILRSLTRRIFGTRYQ